MLATYVPVHVALDIVILTNFDVPASAVSFVVVGNVFLTIATVWLIFWAFDRVRPESRSAHQDT